MSDLKDGRVLATLNEDGSRRWLRPRLARGRFLWGRTALGWFLIGLFVALPHIRVGNAPALMLDIVHRQFTLLGKVFLATDTFLLTLLMLGIFFTVFFVTAVLGRVWCGYGCPQTVYMELLFRPLERWIEGGPAQQRRMDKGSFHPRRLLSRLVFLGISAVLAHTFLAYFVGWDDLIYWMQGSPNNHPIAFLVMVGTTAAVFFDFAWFREQTCLVVCPYGRFQSVLLDRDSLIVGYDRGRGEPRRAPKRKAKEGDEPAGDCIECQACVNVCPTGIDIRDGLQMECIGCAQCIDACDDVMDKVGKDRGLIRYSSENRLAGLPSRLVRMRTVIYPLALVLAFGLLGARLAGEEDAELTLLRRSGAPYSLLGDGRVSNQVRLKIQNRTDRQRDYTLTLSGPVGSELIAPENPIRVPAGQAGVMALFVFVPLEAYAAGELTIELHVTDGDAFEGHLDYLLLGPKEPKP